MPAQYTIRGIPDEVDAALRTAAQRRNISLNHLLVEKLTEAMHKTVRKRDLSRFAGAWEADPDFDSALAQMRENIDWDKWK